MGLDNFTARPANTVHGFAEVSIMKDTCKNKKLAETYCAKCFSPIKAAIDTDSKQFFSNDLFCHCGRRS